MYLQDPKKVASANTYKYYRSTDFSTDLLLNLNMQLSTPQGVTVALKF